MVLLLLTTVRSVVSFKWSPTVTVLSRLFSVNRCLTQGKKNRSTAELEPSIKWQDETDRIFGPVINPKKVAEKKPEKSRKAVEKKTAASSGELSAKCVSKQESKLCEERSESKKIFVPPVLAGTRNYEDVSETEFTTTAQIEPNFDKKAELSPSDKMKSDSSIKNLCNAQDTASLSVTGSGVFDLKEDKTDPRETVGNSDFLSTILAFPPFTISWKSQDGCLSIEKVASKADVEVQVKEFGYPSVTTVLKDTMPPENKFFLDRWEKEMIEELGEDGFQKFKQEMFANGANLHQCVQKFLEGQEISDLNLKESNKGHWFSLEKVLRDVSDVVCTEKPVRHSVLRYKGILDCVASYRGKTCIIDWKTSKKPKSDIKQTFDNPLQLAAYLGAFNTQSLTQTEVDSCLLVIAYQDGSPASVHSMDRSSCLRYWQAWQQRLHLYWSQKLSLAAAYKTPSSS